MWAELKKYERILDLFGQRGVAFAKIDHQPSVDYQRICDSDHKEGDRILPPGGLCCTEHQERRLRRGARDRVSEGI